MGNILNEHYSHGPDGNDAMKPIQTTFDASSIQMAEEPDRILDEEQKSTWKPCKEHRPAILWSLFISISSLMWGYDVLISNGLSAIPGFQEDFGYVHNGVYIISGRWQVAFNAMPYIGGLCGSIATGHYVDKYGRKSPLAVACVIAVGGIFLQIFSEDAGTLLAGKLIHGLSLGSFLTISSSYAAEIVPTKLRFITTSSVQLLIGLGQLLANVILKCFGSGTNDLSYKIPLTIQLIFPIILLCGIKPCPESPWFLLRIGEIRKCRDTLEKLGYPDPEGTMCDMQLTIEDEIADDSGESGETVKRSYLDCFLGDNLRRTEIAVGAFVVSQLVGVVFVIGYSSYFFELAIFDAQESSHQGGLVAASSDAFSLSIGVSALGIIGIVASWFVVHNTMIGRRGLMLYGTLGLMVLLLAIGILDVLPTSSRGPIYAQCVCITIFGLVYFLTVGTTAWVIFAEVGSTSLRSRTCGLSIVAQSLFGISMNIVVPLMINPDEANLSGKIGFIFAGTSLLSLIWLYFRLPETSGRDPAELDVLFREKVPARKFKSYQVESTEP